MTQNLSSLIPSSHIIPLSIWASCILVITLASIVLNVISRRFSQQNPSNTLQAWIGFFLHAVKKPLLALFTVYMLFAIYKICQLLISKFLIQEGIIIYTVDIMEFFIFFWLMFNLLIEGKKHLLTWSRKSNHTTLNIILPVIASGLQAAVFLLMVNLLIPALGLHGLPGIFLAKMVKVMLIATLGWIFYQIVQVLEKFIVNQYILNDANSFAARKINTQVLILKRVILAIGFVVTFAAILMVFDSVKNIGAGLLTTAGIVSAVGAFASQQSLGRLFAGLQIAFTQPIRIGDTIIVEKEFGQVEEITLSYIVVKLWDLRRLILPTDYLTNKGLQNLTRDTTQLLGTIFLYTDYTLPVETVRQKFHELLAASTLWDKKVANFQVTDIKENSMEMRALMSAADSSTLWNLRCEIREQLIQYIVTNFPECLSKSRSLTTQLSLKPVGS